MGVGHCCPATYLTKKQAFVLKDHFQVGFCLGVKTSLHAKLKMWSPHMFIFMYIRILSMKKVFARIRFEIGAQGHSKMASYSLFGKLTVLRCEQCQIYYSACRTLILVAFASTLKRIFVPFI